MHRTDYEFCDDFATAALDLFTGNRARGFEIAEQLGLAPRAAERFAQGYTHARQGRRDLVGTCPHYDAGFNH